MVQGRKALLISGRVRLVKQLSLHCHWIAQKSWASALRWGSGSLWKLLAQLAWLSGFLALQGNVKVTMTEATDIYKRLGIHAVTRCNDGTSDGHMGSSFVSFTHTLRFSSVLVREFKVNTSDGTKNHVIILLVLSKLFLLRCLKCQIIF